MSYITTTNLQIQISIIQKALKKMLDNELNSIGIQLLNILIGFFAATALATIPTHTNDGGIVAAAIIVTNQEIISKIIYQCTDIRYSTKESFINLCLSYCNNIKIGILYGLFVDAFKLGS